VPILLLDHPIAFPVAMLRAALRGRLPTMTWRVGEEDFGARAELATLDKPQTIIGRTADEMVLVSIELRHEPYRPANGHVPPPHRLHAMISRPSTDSDKVARLIALVVGATLAAEQDPGASLQLEAGENWLAGRDMYALLEAASDDPTALQRNLHGKPERFDGAGPEQAQAQAPAPGAPSLSPFQAAVAGSATSTPPSPGPGPTPEAAYVQGKKSLATFTMLLDGEVFIDWPQLDSVMQAIDPDGGWQSVATPGGMGIVMGRASIKIIWAPMPMDRDAIERAYQRSFWFDGDRARVARHSQYIGIHTEAPDDYQAKVATAKIVTLIIGAIAGLPQAVAVFNNEVQTIFSPEMARKQVSILHEDEVPIQLWTWTAPNSMEEGNVSLTTGGFEPFLGYEIEVWNAPHPVDFVADKLTSTLRYLLINGPVIRHGDTIGEAPGDRSIRCFFGETRANRPTPCKVMFLEFDTGAVAEPKKDLPLPPSLRPAVPLAPEVRRVGGFGRKGL
jgi:hypothetical protein